MARDEIAKRYASAIYNIAKSSDSINEVREVLNIFMENYEEEEEFRKILEDPLKKFPEKEKFLEKSFDHFTKESLGIVKYIVKKQRLSLVGDIKEYFLKLYYEENNKLPITAIFAKELSEKQRELLIEKLEKKYDKKIVLNLEVDKEIIGGGILKIGNEVINGSIKNQIEEMKKNF
jgi:ATP synthase F1, delta subunit